MQGSDTQAMTGVDKQRHFIRAMCKSADAESATQDERALLEAILAALLHGKDVSDLIGPGGPTPAGHPTRSESRFTTCVSRGSCT